MVAKFIDEAIEVRFDRTPGPPSAFVWRGKEYVIEGVLQTRHDLDFQKNWLKRRHRDVYIVRVTTGAVYEIYHHRGPGRRYWVLLKETESPV